MPPFPARDVFLYLARGVLRRHLVHAHHVVVGKIDFRVLVEQPLYRRFLVGLAGEQPQILFSVSRWSNMQSEMN